MRKRIMMAIAALLVVAIAGTALWYNRDRQTVTPVEGIPFAGDSGPAEVTLRPVKADNTGVDAAGGFVLTAQTGDLRARDLEKHLTLEPPVPITVEETKEKEFLVKPAAALEQGRVYRVKLAPAAGLSRAYQWSFQTRSTFRITGSLPRNQSSGVPVNTGIELIFSHETFGDVTPLFSITPAVAGSFERYKKTLAFVPKDPLAPGTVYTITLRKGLTLTGTDLRLTDDFQFSFETEPAGGPKTISKTSFSVPEGLLEYAAGETPYFLIYADSRSQPLDVAVYRYKDAAAFAAALQAADKVPWWANWSRGQYLEETAGLTRVAAFDGALQEYEHFGTYLHMPEPVPPGYYIATLKLNDESRQLRFQVTDLASYAAISTTQTLVWLNDLATGKPVPGAKVTFAGNNISAATGADGVAVLPTPPGADDQASRTGVYLHVSAGAKEAVVAAPWERYYYYYSRFYGSSGGGRAVQYWRYVYLDRQLYKPDDTVNIWGVVRPREPGAAKVDAVTAVVTRGGYYGEDNAPVPLAKATIPVADGNYTGKLELPGLKTGWYEVQILLDGETLTSRYFEVENYVKPAYRLESKLSKRAVFSGDPVDLTVKAAFFEGTPVPGLPLTYSLNREGSLITGPDGTATVTLRPEGHNSYGYDYTWYSVHASLPEAGELSDGGTLLVYSRDMMLETQVKVEDGRAVVTGQVNRISLDALNSGDTWDTRGAPVPSRQVELELVQQNWNKVETGQYYDFIQKTVHKLYDYRPAHKQIGTYTALTGDGGKFSHTLTVDPKQSYTVKVRIKDSKDRTIDRELWFAGRSYEGFSDTLYWGRWTNLTPVPEGKYTWGLGEPVTLEMRQEQAALKDRPQGFLFYTARLGLQEHKVQDSSRFTYALKEKDLPSISVGAVSFDGRSYSEAGTFTVRFDPKERELKVTVEPDKPSYKPGEAVNLAVRVTDQTGKPVKAQVNLNLVDEAIYAMRDQQVDLLYALYNEYMPTGILRTRRSHQVPKPMSMAEKGGDGGGVRKEFKDAVFFATVATDAQGRASASFKVPDNLTTWRVTYQALAPATMQAASGTVGVVVRLPFFVETVQADTYLTGDQPVVTARTYGTALQASHSARVSASLEGPATWQAADLTARAFDPLGLKLPKLEKAGTYRLTVRAEGPEGLKDAIEKPITVVDSYLRQKKVDFTVLEEGTKVPGPEQGTVTLLLSDYERGRYFRLLQQAKWQWGNRLEQKLARQSADQLLKAHFDLGDTFWWWGEEPEVNTHAYQTENGGVAYLPYADADLHLSALAADLLPGGFDESDLEGYFQQVLGNDQEDRERKLIALYGMAALNRPVLLQAWKLMEQTDLSLMEQLYLALILAELGDLEAARPLYQAILKEHGEQFGANGRIKTGRDQDEILTHTAMAGMIAAKLGEPEAPAFAGYLLENWPKEVLLVLEQAIMAADGMPRLADKPVAFTYVLDGQETRKELKAGRTLPLTVTAKQAAAMQFKGLEGKVGLTAIYEAPLTRAELKQREGFSVTRTYSSPTNTFKVGDLVKVTISLKIPATAPGGAYELTDYLPSGLRIVSRPWQHGIRWGAPNDPAWPLDVNGQKVIFWVGSDAYPINYYARVVTAGQYTAEEPVLQHSRSGIIFGFGQRAQVKIE